MALPECTCRVSEYLMNYPMDICASNIMKSIFLNSSAHTPSVSSPDLPQVSFASGRSYHHDSNNRTSNRFGVASLRVRPYEHDGERENSSGCQRVIVHCSPTMCLLTFRRIRTPGDIVSVIVLLHFLSSFGLHYRNLAERT